MAWNEVAKRLTLVRVRAKKDAKSRTVTASQIEIWEEHLDDPQTDPKWVKAGELPLSVDNAGQGSRLAFSRNDPDLMLAVIPELDAEVGLVSVWDIRKIAPPALVAAMAMSPPAPRRGVLLFEHAGRNAIFNAAGDRIVIGTDRQAALWSLDRERLSEARRSRAAIGEEFARNAYADVVRPLVQLDHGTSVFSVAFSPDGRYVATGGRGGVARVWDLVTCKQAFPQVPHCATVNQVSFTADGHALLTIDGRFQTQTTIGRRWSLRNIEPMLGSLDEPESPDAQRISPDGRYVITAHPAGGRRDACEILIRDWSPSDGKDARAALATTERRREVITLPRGETAKSLECWQNGERNAVVVVSTVASFPGGGPDWGMAAANSKATSLPYRIRWYDFTSSAKPRLRFEASTANIIHFARVSGDGKRLVTCSADGTARLWPFRNNGGVLDVARATKRPASGGKPSKRNDKSGLEPAVIFDHKAAITDVAWDLARQRLLTCGVDGTLKLWSWEKSRPRLELAVAYPGQLQQAVLATKPGRIVAVGSVSPRLATPLESSAESAGPISSQGAPLRHVAFWRIGLDQDNLPSVDGNKRDLKQLLAREFDADSVTIRPIDPGTLDLNGNLPAVQFGTGQNLAWHLRHARDCEVAQIWSAADWHLSEVLNSDLRGQLPDKEPLIELLLRRAAARQRTADRLNDAWLDLDEASQLSGGLDVVALRRRAEVRRQQAQRLDPSDTDDEQSRKRIDFLKQAADDYGRVLKFVGRDLWKDRVALANSYAELLDGTQLNDAILDQARKQLELAVEELRGDDRLTSQAARISYYLAILQLAAGDIDGYRRTTRDMSVRFRDGTDGMAVRLFAWTCALSDQCESDGLTWADVRRAKERSYRPTNLDDLNTLAAVLYRAGDDKLALEALENAIKLSKRRAEVALAGEELTLASSTRIDSVGTPYDWVFLALTHAQNALANPLDATSRQQALDRRAVFQHWLVDNVKSPYPTIRFRLPWYVRLEFLLLEKEVASTFRRLEDSTSPDSNNR